MIESITSQLKQMKNTVVLKDDLILKLTSITDNLANQIKQKDEANKELRDHNEKLKLELESLRKQTQAFD